MNDILAFSDFLKYGPLGLAALLLVLVVIALQVQKLEPARVRILEQFMYVGASCFALSLLTTAFSVRGSYEIHFKVIPIQMDMSTLPPPVITMNGAQIDLDKAYLIRSEATAIVDVTRALSAASNSKQTIEKQRAAIRETTEKARMMVADLSRVPQIIDKNCSGGSNGVSANSNPAVIDITTRAVSSASAITAVANAALIE